MTFSRRDFLFYSSGLAVSLLMPKPGAAQESAGEVVLTTLPATITEPGTYVLAANHTLSLLFGAAIDIQADGVVVDLRGYAVSNTAGGSTHAVGLFADNRVGIEVKNGTIEGFHTAVCFRSSLGGSARHILSGVTASNYQAAGFLVHGHRCVIKDNVLTTSMRTATFTFPGCFSTIMGIALSKAPGSIVLDNTVELNDAGLNDFAIGMFFGNGSRDLVVVGNEISGADLGMVFDEPALAMGEVRDTQFQSVGRGIVGGLSLGNNT